MTKPATLWQTCWALALHEFKFSSQCNKFNAEDIKRPMCEKTQARALNRKPGLLYSYLQGK